MQNLVIRHYGYSQPIRYKLQKPFTREKSRLMNTQDYIALNRQFSPILKDQDEAENTEIRIAWGHEKPKLWCDLFGEYRCVILAEAGAGKTEEFRQQTRILANQGKTSFFIRIEDIGGDFFKSFEIGNESQFHEWLQSTEDAWFFLDSVDEARLESPKLFEKSLRYFSKAIESAAHRAHIYISSRPYAWRPTEDKTLLNQILFLPNQHENNEDSSNKYTTQSALMIYAMRPLDRERFHLFCVNHNTTDIDRLLREVEHANLWSLAERPFDLEGILAKWEKDKSIDGRLELLRHNIEKRLSEDHNTNRAQLQPLNLSRAQEGARRLAAAVVLCGQAGINVPDKEISKPGINAEHVLSDWNPQDVRALLDRGIFNDVIYGAVRFRHREVRELLAAEWFDHLLKTGNSRHPVEALFFRDQYGEKIIAPKLRPIISWLILFDDQIRRKALDIHPEIAVEGGDPARLPLQERQEILADIVRRIASREDWRSAQDHDAISRIANKDLSNSVLNLLRDFGNSDDVIFFLGRLVSQGQMSACAENFIGISTDSSRGIYARTASARAVISCGSSEQKRVLWEALNKSEELIPRRLLTELIQEDTFDSQNIDQFLASLGRLSPHVKYEVTGLSQSLHDSIERLSSSNDQTMLVQFTNGLHGYLDSSPYIERQECRVSEGYAWLLSIAVHAAEKLVEARNPAALSPTIISIMLMVPALRFWGDSDFTEHKGNLANLVPLWPEFNDAIYWASIEQARTNKYAKSKEPLTDDYSIHWLGHFWKFDTESLPRLLDYMHKRPLQDDRMMALSTAFRVYIQENKPDHILKDIQAAANDDEVLKKQLDAFLNPKKSEALLKMEADDKKYAQKNKMREHRKKQNRDRWIAELRNNPDRVRNPPGLEPGELSNDQYWLWHEIQGGGIKTSRCDGENWKSLISEFGEPVATAYRDAAIKHWRNFTPTLQSEGVIRDNSIPYSLIFALVGLEIEAAETLNFPDHLTEAEVRHALRYITWDINGFPRWLEPMYKALPTPVEHAVAQELLWELDNALLGKTANYILHDLVYYAPWLHSYLAPVILDWLRANLSHPTPDRHHCVHILVSGETDPEILATLASEKIAHTGDIESIAWWYALRVDCNPEDGIPEVSKWLSALDIEEAKNVAQIFITTLLGGRHSRGRGRHIGLFRTPKHLKLLYVLAHRYILKANDIDRANGGAYSPTLRDDAQDARDRIFNLLSEIPGNDCYIALMQLTQDHPDPSYRHWMKKQAYKRAEEDGDLELWTEKQAFEFNTSQFLTPKTHRQLFDLGSTHLNDLKDWVENGNDSPWKTWQRVPDETEMRTLITGQLNQRRQNQYTTAQEPELANKQRMDIWLNNPNVDSPVPIELKLLDQDWSGNDLCERLRNQLVGDYMREKGASCGFMLLISKNAENKNWIINGKKIGINGLAESLKNYWKSISGSFPGVNSIEVIVINLSIRGEVSSS